MGLDRKDQLGGGAKRIGSEIHRYRASMARTAQEAIMGARLSSDGGNDAHGQILLFQRWPLLDMDLARPRGPEMRDAPRFFELVAEVRRHLREVDPERE